LYVTTAVIYSDNTMGSCAESFSDSNDIERAALKLLFLNARRMEIVLCIVISIIVSAVVSILMLKFFAYKYFEVIDSYIKGLFDNFRNTTGYK